MSSRYTALATGSRRPRLQFDDTIPEIRYEVLQKSYHDPPFSDGRQVATFYPDGSQTDRTDPMKRTLLLAFVALLATPTASAQSPLELFQQARRLESVQGDLEGAIALYERIGETYGSDRALGARALLQMAQAYETLGQNDATRTYRRIVSEFADQEETVAMAEEALGRLVLPRKRRDVASLLGPAAQYIDEGAALSRDGKFVVFTNWGTGRMGYLELGQDEIHWMTPEYAFQSYAFWGRFSPDNKEIAYAWSNGPEGSQAIRVYDRGTGEVREILNDAVRFGRLPRQGHTGVFDWSTDGTQILTEVRISKSTARLGLIDRQTGAHRAYVDLPHFTSDSACLLEDRIVLFEDESNGKHRVMAADLLAKTVDPFLANSASSRLIGCSSKERTVFITSNEFGEFSAWAYRLDAGIRVGPRVAIGDIPSNAVAAGGLVSDDGTVLFLNTEGSTSTELFRMRDGAITERVLSMPVGGSLFRLGWSPDGRHFAYVTGLNFLHVADTLGSHRGIGLPQRNPVTQWLPDGSGLIYTWRNERQWLSTRISHETGFPLDADTLSGPFPDPGRAGQAVISAYRKDNQTICVREYEGGHASQRELVCYPDSAAAIARPAGAPGSGLWPQTVAGSNQIIVGANTGQQGERHFYHTLVDIDSGETRVILRDQKRWRRLAQLPNSGEFVTDRMFEEPFRITPDGQLGEAVFKQFGDLRQITSYSFHPSGKLVLISSRAKTSDPAESRPRVGMLLELWDRLN
jgi:hypothetical protein